MASSRWFMAGFVLSAALVAAIQVSAAARLHWPLPENSLERNGVRQMKTSHVIMSTAVDPALPNVGLHPHAAKGLKRRYSGAAIDVLNYHYDNYPTGWNQSETDLTPTTVHSASFGQITTLNVDGNVIAQPLMVSNFTMPDNSVHNVLIVATGHNSVYAYDAQSYTLLWRRRFGAPQTSGDVGCSDIKPEYGISSTPVIVRSASNAATMYLVVASEPAPFSFHTKIHAVDLGTGKDIMAPKEIDPRAHLATGGQMHFDPQNQWNRASLAYNNGSIYVGIGSHCDNNAGDISGWIVRYDASNLKLLDRFNTIEAAAGYELASVWMADYAPAISPDGHVYAITGNGNYDLTKGHKGYGESVIGLSADLQKTTVDSFTPAEFQSLNDGDTDFGSGGAMLIPTIAGQVAPPMLVAQGKAGVIYLLDSTHLGGLEGAPNNPLQKLDDGACWCGAAYYVGPSGGMVFYQGNGALKGYSVNTSATPSLTNTINGTSNAGGGGTFPIVSTNGNTPNTGVVWVIKRAATEQLEAYNAATLGAPIFASNAGNWSNGSRAYLTPLVANGRVYVGAFKTVTVFGLTD